MLELEHLRRRYEGEGGVTAVSMHVPPAAIYVLCGANGSGKSTTLSVLAGLLFAEAGSLSIGGHPVPLDRHAPRRGMGFVPDTPILDEHLTPSQWLAFVAGMKGTEIPTHAPDTAGDLLIPAGALHEPIRSLSFGNRRKVALWVEFVTTSRLLLLDEPLIGLDPASIEGFHRVARTFVGDGRSLVLSTHLLREAEALASHVGIIHHGRTLVQGTLDEVRGQQSLQDAFLDEVRA